MFMLFVGLAPALAQPDVRFETCYVGPGPRGSAALLLFEDGDATFVDGKSCASRGDGVVALRWEPFEQGFLIRLDLHRSLTVETAHPDFFGLTWAHDIDPEAGGRGMYFARPEVPSPPPAVSTEGWYQSPMRLEDPGEAASVYFWVLAFDDSGRATLGRLHGGLEAERVARSGFGLDDPTGTPCTWTQEGEGIALTCNAETLRGTVAVGRVELELPQEAPASVTLEARRARDEGAEAP